MISFDSNLLVYAVDRDSGHRHSRAADLVERGIRGGNCVQPLQTLAEFFNVSTRKIGLAPEAAALYVVGWCAVLPVKASSTEDLDHAMRAVAEHGLSFWDAMLWATARRIGARFLISEDFQDGRSLEGVLIVNPFAASNDPIIDRIVPATGLASP